MHVSVGLQVDTGSGEFDGPPKSSASCRCHDAQAEVVTTVVGEQRALGPTRRRYRMLVRGALVLGGGEVLVVLWLLTHNGFWQ